VTMKDIARATGQKTKVYWAAKH